MNPPRLVAVVLNWNNAPDTLRCLDLALLENRENLGYAGGNNVGIQYALDRGADYVLLLNDDAVVAPDALSALLDAAQDHPGVGFLGPKVLSLEEPRQLLSAGGILDREWRSSHRGADELDEGQFDELAEVDWLSGCALLVSREAIRRVGMLDPAFFAYHEDVDWCYRGRQAGLGVLLVPGAKVWHPDTRVQQLDSPLVTYYMARNSLLFLSKHRLGTDLLLRRLGRYLYRLVSWSIRSGWRHKRQQRDALLRAVLDFGRRRFGRSALVKQG
jgi:GT2 family glycosyltransferase